ncbi:uncharacterized protein EKO05_0007469 [Ascochyta rabiei]|uniref:uncharacterized protein n=1 Tax=Didymella rabiei TaxID=5454 RepID=UPI0021FD213B|nr:uncharacterized protein EKO05_0007469 [Ascochyta rabiei]UPX17093.1 hypothetical protein EKO05_0007469 [Ascochyta rabiei]
MMDDSIQSATCLVAVSEAKSSKGIPEARAVLRCSRPFFSYKRRNLGTGIDVFNAMSLSVAASF